MHKKQAGKPYFYHRLRPPLPRKAFWQKKLIINKIGTPMPCLKINFVEALEGCFSKENAPTVSKMELDPEVGAKSRIVGGKVVVATKPHAEAT